ncbi:MAG TPA: cytochrome C [Deltaproteobacteria bacterium]|nr:cytochrome C [Deltaproteobacteria bacterium]
MLDSSRGRRRFVRAGLGFFVFALFGLVVRVRSAAVIERVHSVPEEELRLSLPRGPLDPIERGRHLATAIAQCDFCHGHDFSGKRVVDDPWSGRLHAANLTAGKGGIGGDYDQADWIRAIRFGLRRDGRTLFLMPTAHLSAITDADLAALIAYMRTLAPVVADRPPTRVGWLMRVVLGLGIPIPDLVSARDADLSRRPPRALPIAATAEQGSYLLDLGNCRFCHGGDLRGGRHPLARAGEPAPPDLTAGGSLSGWSRNDFARAMRTGRTPDGRLLDREFMPWPGYAGLEEVEIDALWLALTGRSGGPEERVIR